MSEPMSSERTSKQRTNNERMRKKERNNNEVYRDNRSNSRANTWCLNVGCLDSCCCSWLLSSVLE